MYKIGRKKKPQHWENAPHERSAANSVDRVQATPGHLNLCPIVAGRGSGSVGALRGIASTWSQRTDQRPETQNSDRECVLMRQVHPEPTPGPRSSQIQCRAVNL